MEYIEKDMSSYKLHIIKTNRFKTLNIRVCFKNEVKKSDITLSNMLIDFLVYSTDTYPTKRDIIFKCEDLYATEVYARTNKLGNINVVNFNMNLLDEKYTEEGMYEESIKFFADILFNPNFNKEDKFKNAFDFLYKQYERNLNNFKENKSGYSISRLLETMGKNKKYGYKGIGYIEDLKKIDKKKLIDYYNKLINDSKIDIYVIGNVNDDIIKYIDKYFKFNDRNINIKDIIIKHNRLPRKIVEVKEKDDSSQSKLAVGCIIKDLTTYERNYVLSIYNSILGSSSESKFFQIIREKNSLAYYVNSSLKKVDDLMIIRAGISRNNYRKVVNLIKKLMNDMTLGKFSDEDIKVAKENYISMINEIYDNQDEIVDAYFAEDILELDNLEERKERINSVSKEDIINISKKVAIDTIYLLDGVGGNNED